MFDTIIIGNGPAGISTALYTTRANLKTLIIGKDTGALKNAHEIENYYGFENPISGKQLIENGIQQAKRLGATIMQDEVVGLGYLDGFEVTTKSGVFYSNSLVIATGTSRSTPGIKGIKELEGRGVSYCAVCDAFFYRGKDVAVLGNGDYALHEAMELLSTANSVTLLTNGENPPLIHDSRILIDTRIIKSILGRETLEAIEFEDNSTKQLSGLFIAVGVAGSTALAKKIGAQTESSKIIVDEKGATSIPGVYAAGDCTGGLLQISKAVYEGTFVGTEVIKHIRKQKKEQTA
jgi:thioredoxin reductase (NADPH)